MIRFFYTLIFYLCTPLILLRLLWRAKKAPAYARRWGERFGFFNANHFIDNSLARHTPSDQKIIWLHAVSVGETLAAAPLIHRLLENNNISLIVTTTTPTGSEQVKKLFSDVIANYKILHVYAPYDLPDCIARFVRRTKPDLYVIMETELWPNTIAQCNKKNIPVILANGRLSEKSAKGYQKIQRLIGKTFSQITDAAIQHGADAERMIELGLNKDHCHVTGNIKFDLTIDESIREKAEKIKSELNRIKKRFVWLVASTHKGEDEIIIDAFQRAKEKIENLLLVLVPRHPERFDDVVLLCRSKELHVQQRSHHEPLLENTDVLVGDTMGELLILFGTSDVTFVGGSLVPVGGHNVIEPAAWGLPIITGPHLFNFTEATQLLRDANAIEIVDSARLIAKAVVEVAENEEHKKMMGARAREVVENNRGALDKLLTIIYRALSI